MLKTAIEKLLVHERLSEEEAGQIIWEVMDGGNLYLLAAFLVLLRERGETANEIAGLANGMLSLMVPVPVEGPVMDITGTGGDNAHTLNISTGSSLLAAACGVKIAKHGNRSVSSRCGSADILEELGIKIDMGPEGVIKCIEEAGIGFMYAPRYHPALKVISEVRKSLSMRTAFNLVGCLLNPAQAKFRMIGVSQKDKLDVMARVLQKMGVFHALVFYGSGIDEISTLGVSEVRQIHKGRINKWILDPIVYGLSYCSLADLKGGDVKENSARLLEALSGRMDPYADTLALNAGIAQWLYGATNTIQEGIKRAFSCLRQGKALDVLQKWKRGQA